MEYDRETAKELIKDRISCAEFLEKSQRGNFCCPFCGSGKGPDKSGALKAYPETKDFYCFSCGKRGDAIDLYQKATGKEYGEALSDLAGSIGITIAHYIPDDAGALGNMRTEAEKTPIKETPKKAAEVPADYTGYYRACAARLSDPAAVAYLEKRGISLETARAYMLGYDPEADPASAPGGSAPALHPCPRLIIPTSREHYVARQITEGDKRFAKINPKGSAPALFNGRALYQGAKEIFITEGVFDALAVIEAGSSAIALNSTSNAAKLLDLLKERRTEATLILCLDNDEAGKKKTEELRNGLQKLDVSNIEADICCGKKDPNEALTSNRGAFVRAVEAAKRTTAAKPDNTSYYIDALMGEEIKQFKGEKSTGFPGLDQKCGGGLYAGLYALAAISSLGKTSFALQMADQLAAGGNDVIFFSLEQSRLELVSRSLSRISYQLDPDNALTSLDIRKGRGARCVKEAAEIYKQRVGDRISIREGNFSAGLSSIGQYIENYIARTESRPVVFIDYLQIIRPEENDRRSTKDLIDLLVSDLRRLSREKNLTIFIISSVNRANYQATIDFEALKESGGIEYTCDVVFGLQLECVNGLAFDKVNNIKERRDLIKAAKAENPRKIELCCLKNRFGIANFSCHFEYFPAYDFFKEKENPADLPKRAARDF